MVSPQLADFASRMREQYRSRIPNAGAPDPVAEVRTLAIPAAMPARSIQVRGYWPLDVERAGLPIVVFAHGGGWVSGDLETHDVMCRALANRARALVLSVAYRLAPEHPYPAAVDDLYAVLTWVAEHGASLDGDTGRIVVSGDSAGGEIATVAAIVARDRGGPSLLAQLLLYPCVAHAMDTPSWSEFGETFPSRRVMALSLESYVHATSEASPQAIVPLLADLRALPPTLILVGSKDPLRDESRAYAEKLSAEGVDAACAVHSGEAHGYIQFFKDRAGNPLGEAALDEGVAFLVKHFTRASAARGPRTPR